MKNIKIKKAGILALFIILLTSSLSTVAVADWESVSFGGTVIVEDDAAPVNSNPYPADGATGVSINLNTYNITVNDPDGDAMDVYLYSNNTVDDSWFSWKNITGVSNGTQTWVGSHDAYGDFLGMGSGDLDYSTTYYWSANTTDGNGNWDNDTYSFTTGPEPPNPSITIEKAANISSVEEGSTYANVNYTIWVNNTGNVNFDWVLINDTKFNCTCHDFYENAMGWGTNASEETGFTLTHDVCWRTFNYTSALNASDTLVFWYNKTIYNCSGVTQGLAINTANVTVNQSLATDEDTWTITWGNVDAPIITNPTPANGSTYVNTALGQVSADISSKNTFDYTIELYSTTVSDDKGQTSGSNANNGTKTFDFTGALSPGQNYTFWVNATDTGSGNSTNESFWFVLNNSYTWTIEKTGNVTVVNQTEAAGDNLVNYTIWINNTGTGTITNINLNETLLNCSCSDWNMYYINSNFSDITFHNDSCYMSITIPNQTAGNHTWYWLSVNITNCTSDLSGIVRNYANITGTYASPASAYHDIAWSKLTSRLEISYTSRGARLQPIATAAVVLTMIVSIVIVAAIILRRVNNLNQE